MLERFFQTVVRSTCLLPACLMLCAGCMQAEPELVSIQTLFSTQAALYFDHTVTLQGVASEVESSGQLRVVDAPSCPTLYGQATFLLDDETGLLPIKIEGSCHAKTAKPLPKNGQRVRITAIVRVPDSPIPPRITAQATTIKVLE